MKKIVITIFAIFICVYSFAQVKMDVGGVVKDSGGNPIPGVGIFVENTSTGTVTDIQGEWTLNVEQGQKLVFSSLGYDTQTVTVGKSTIIDIVLNDDAKILDEVVVVGYGTQNRKALSTAVAKVDGDKFADIPVATVGDALKGKVTGLNIVSNNNLPGETPMFMIRGGSSINRSNSPLCLVDGIERSFDDINPKDIQSIEVFKDAASSAIYGSRASNGVILVTTNKGNHSVKPQITFDAQVGFTSPSRTWNLANSTDYLNIVRPAALQGPNASLVLNGANGAGTGNTSPTAIYSTR